ncbi:Protein CASP [Trichoplax sp. H2]|nr:Protein CASP [Trichoplax sp. H2]|eukprot:RDD38035.1 Protein CASP [Trichoplax sp. H2]
MIFNQLPYRPATPHSIDHHPDGNEQPQVRMASTLIDYWKQFDFNHFQKELESTAHELASNQDTSDASRKKLVEQTKQFKKGATDDIRKQTAPLLKNFQNEIDALRTRCKAAETAFLKVFQKLADANDPAPALSQLLKLQQKLQDLQDYEIENAKLRETINDYKNEFLEVKNQEVTIKSLNEKIKEYEERMENTIQAKTKETQKLMRKEFAEKESQLQEKQVSMATKLGDAEQQAATMRKAMENAQTELFELKLKFDEEKVAKAAEMEMLVTDLERAANQSQQHERELNDLKGKLLMAESQLANQPMSPSTKQTFEIARNTNLELELTSKEHEINQLVEEIHKLQSAITKTKESHVQKLNLVETELEEKADIIHELRMELAAKQDYDDIKNELNVMKMIEFPSNYNDTDSADSQKPKTIEILLIEKNKALQSENTSLKLLTTNQKSQLNELNERYSAAQQRLQEKEDLINQLEKDLASINTVSPVQRGERDDAVNLIATESLVGSVDIPNQASKNSSDNTANSTESLLHIVTSQRERLKSRVVEVETEKRHLQHSLNVLQGEVDGMRSDNVKLYEKIKFLENYPTKASNTETLTQEDDTVNRYSKQYEDSINPFSTFNKKEKQKRYLNLSPSEKATLNLGRFIMSSKTARVVAFFYTIVLHMLVFMVLFKLAYTESCKHDFAVDCVQKFAEHMQKFHTKGSSRAT